jgi:hypothetical protein
LGKKGEYLTLKNIKKGKKTFLISHRTNRTMVFIQRKNEEGPWLVKVVIKKQQY